MKISLPLKLGIFVVLLFAVVIAACLLWTPVKIRYYVGKLRSDDTKERVAGVDGLLSMRNKGYEVLSLEKNLDKQSMEFLRVHWNNRNFPVEGHHRGHFPIHLAAQLGIKKVIPLLLDGGIDIEVENGEKSTPLQTAVYADKFEVVELLIQRGADISRCRMYGGGNLLHSVIPECPINVGRLIISKGADVNAEWSPVGMKSSWFIKKRTPLDTAASYGNTDWIRLLIKKGADINHLDGFWKTALDAAIESKRSNPEAIHFLRTHGGKTGEELKAEKK